MTLPNPLEPPRLDGPPIARRRVTRRVSGSSPLADDDVPVLLRIADLTARHPAAADPVKPEPPSAVIVDPADIEEPATIKFVPASSDPPNNPADPAEPTKPIDPPAPSGTTAATSRDKNPLRKPPGERRRREIPPPVETRKSVATQWGAILVLVVAIAAAYFWFTVGSGDKPDDTKANRDKQPSTNFVPANIEPAPADAKNAAPSHAQQSNENIADPAVPQFAQKPSGDPPAVDTTMEPTLDGPRQESKERRPAPPPLNRRTAPPAVDTDVPPVDGPLEREARQPAAPSAYPETDPATFDYAPDNRRVAAPPENVYEAGSARLNRVQSIPPRDRR